VRGRQLASENEEKLTEASTQGDARSRACYRAAARQRHRGACVITAYKTRRQVTRSCCSARESGVLLDTHHEIANPRSAISSPWGNRAIVQEIPNVDGSRRTESPEATADLRSAYRLYRTPLLPRELTQMGISARPKAGTLPAEAAPTDICF